MGVFDSARISPTALYTCETWARHGRSFPELSLPMGAVFYNSMQPAMLSSKWFGGPTLQDFLLARHDLIDAHLTKQIDQYNVRYVIEIAAGLSPRGMRYIKRYPQEIHYFEADLPGMMAIKRKRLKNHLKDYKQHKLFAIDAFAEQGPHSLSNLFQSIPEGEPVCVITEGLLNYFSREQVERLGLNFSREFKSRAGSSYVSDIHLQAQNQGPVAEGFKNMLGAFVRGKVHLHYQDSEDIQNAFKSIQLQVELITPSDHKDRLDSCGAKWADLVKVLVARHSSG